jgi:hypothetical protein
LCFSRGIYPFFLIWRRNKKDKRETVTAEPGTPPAGRKTWEDLGEEFRELTSIGSGR